MRTVSEDAAQIISDAVPNLPQDDFQKLISDLSMALAPASGLRSDDVDVDELIRLMENYTSKEEEWQRYALADFNLGYTRNLVDEGNGKSNLLILVWSPGKGSPIHDHADAHCVMKILKGSLKETIYSWPDRNLTGDGKPSPPEMKRESIYRQGQVNYMSDELGLHSITNLDPSDVAVSLHLYTPPHAARVGAHIYDERTGKSSHVLQPNYYSVHGIYTDNI